MTVQISCLHARGISDLPMGNVHGLQHLLAAVMAGALFTPACTDCCDCYCWWSTLAPRPIEPWAILICRRLTTTAIIVLVPLKQLVLFHECCYY